MGIDLIDSVLDPFGHFVSFFEKIIFLSKKHAEKLFKVANEMISLDLS